jgi:transcriptional regulator with XRE-family HTH domain
MDIGNRIRKLREEKLLSQNELALQLGISQTTLHNIESGNPQKIDFALMEKVCLFFDKDLSYFTDDKVINNNVNENKGQVGCETVTINNNYPENILLEIQNLINENKLLKAKIAEFEK